MNNQAIRSEEFILCFDSNKVYYEENDTIFLLYDFNAKKNDTWVTRIQNNSLNNPYPEDSLRTVTVDSISEIIISEDTLKVLYTSTSFGQYTGGPDFYLKNPIIEKIGADYFFMEPWPVMDLNIPYLRCYVDDSISYSTNLHIPCDTIIVSSLGLNNDFEQNNLILFPNPSNGLIQINIDSDKIITLEVYDLMGKKISFKDFLSNTQIDLSCFSDGLYILTFKENENVIWREKIIKQ